MTDTVNVANFSLLKQHCKAVSPISSEAVTSSSESYSNDKFMNDSILLKTYRLQIGAPRWIYGERQSIEQVYPDWSFKRDTGSDLLRSQRSAHVRTRDGKTDNGRLGNLSRVVSWLDSHSAAFK